MSAPSVPLKPPPETRMSPLGIIAIPWSKPSGTPSATSVCPPDFGSMRTTMMPNAADPKSAT
jgi:hypothetical protein